MKTKPLSFLLCLAGLLAYAGIACADPPSDLSAVLTAPLALPGICAVFPRRTLRKFSSVRSRTWSALPALEDHDDNSEADFSIPIIPPVRSLRLDLPILPVSFVSSLPLPVTDLHRPRYLLFKTLLI